MDKIEARRNIIGLCQGPLRGMSALPSNVITKVAECAPATVPDQYIKELYHLSCIGWINQTGFFNLGFPEVDDTLVALLELAL